MVCCFAYDCKYDSRSGKSTFAFPSNTPSKRELRKKWIAACNRKRKDIESAKFPRLCEEHFSPNAFNKIPELAKQLGYRLDLKPDAVPDPQRFIRRSYSLNSSHDSLQPKLDTKSGRKRKSLAFQKRQNLEIIANYEKQNNNIAEPTEETSPSTEPSTSQSANTLEQGHDSVKTLGHSTVSREQASSKVNVGHSAEEVRVTTVNVGDSAEEASITAVNAGQPAKEASITEVNVGQSAKEARITAVYVGQSAEEARITAVNVGHSIQEVNSGIKLEVNLPDYGDVSNPSSEPTESSCVLVQIPAFKKVSTGTQTPRQRRVKSCQTNSLKYHGMQMISGESPPMTDQGCDPIFPPEIQLIGLPPSHSVLQ